MDYLIRKADSLHSRKFLIHYNRIKRYFGQVDENAGADVDVKQLKQEPGTKDKRPYKKNPKCSR